MNDQARVQTGSRSKSNVTQSATKQSPDSQLKRVFRSLRSLVARQPHELDVLSAYAEWSHNYPSHAHNALMRVEEKAMLELAPDLRDKIALDLACGTGRYMQLLKDRGARRVIGIDLSPEMLRLNDHAPLVRADLLQLPILPNLFDVITCALAIGHVEDLTRAIAETARVLKRGGTLLYSDFHPLGYLAGWRREFNGRDGKRYAVKHFAHLYSDHVVACSAAGLTIRALREPVIGRDLQEDFPRSAEVYSRWDGWPAVLIIRADKN